ncbi:hypothetical protein UMZ34_03230 [Halopseudomonas pachastrellae]|nr:hypothetical protein UMZ34_03230 [Halopseudomonas pachastrellae]
MRFAYGARRTACVKLTRLCAQAPDTIDDQLSAALLQIWRAQPKAAGQKTAVYLL